MPASAPLAPKSAPSGEKIVTPKAMAGIGGVLFRKTAKTRIS
jgi:hypothetical protein